MSDAKAKQCLSLLTVCRWAINYALRRYCLLLAVIGSRVAGVGLDMLKPWPLVFLVDYVLRGRHMPPYLERMVVELWGGASPSSLISLVVALTVVMFVLGWLLNLADSYAFLCLRQAMNNELAGDIFYQLQQRSMQFHAHAAVAENMRRITSDSTCASTIVLDALLPAGTSTLSLVTIFAILWRMDPVLAALSLTVVPYMVLVLNRFAEPLKKGIDDMYVQDKRLYTLVEQSFRTIPVVQAFCRENWNVARFRQSARAVLGANMARNRTNRQFGALMGLATAVSSAGILWIGGQKALAGTVSVGILIAFLSYLGSLYKPIEKILRTAPTVQDAANRAVYIWEILRSETHVRDNRGAKRLQVLQGHVVFKNVTFGYDVGHPVLQTLTFEALPGQTVALVGATGAGKTTLVSLLARFFDPWEGAVLIDDQDIRHVQLKSLRNSIAFVLQEPFLFPVSIAENIAYGDPSAIFSQIESAARAANANGFICKLAAGYNTIVGERGATLSRGERQRISIARALLKNAPILVLDEPTSALDTETEQYLLRDLRRLRQGRTTFIIAHRLSTIRHADVILVLGNGRIAESGTHDQLVARGGIYAGFYDLRFGEKVALAKTLRSVHDGATDASACS